MNNILFPTDFSDTSAQLLQFAFDYAETVNAKLTLFNAYQPTYSPRRPIIGEFSAKEHTIQKLRNFAKLHTDGDRWKKINFRARKGYSIRSIIKLSKSPEFDMIIMGKGAGYDWLTKFIGSKTSYVSKMAHCPVLVVPPGQTLKDTKQVIITGYIPTNGEKKLRNYLDGINFNNTGAEYSVISMDKPAFLQNQFGFRRWPRIILGLEIPALVINKRFWQSRTITQKSKNMGMERLINSSKLGTNLN